MIDLMLRRRSELMMAMVQEPPEEAVHPDMVRYLIKTTNDNTRISFLYNGAFAYSQESEYILDGVAHPKTSPMTIPLAGMHDVFIKMGTNNRINSGMNGYALYCRLNYTGAIHNSYLYDGGNAIKMLDIPTETLNQSNSYFLRSLGTSTVKLVRVPKGTLAYYKNHAIISRFADKIVETKKFNDFMEVFNSL